MVVKEKLNISLPDNYDNLLTKIRQDSQLGPSEKLLLYTLHSYGNGNKNSYKLKKLASDTSLNKEIIKKTIYKLKTKGWINQKQDRQKNVEIKKEEKEFIDNQQGNKIACQWKNIFETKQLTPTSLKKLISFIEDGMEEELILKVMRISAERAHGNPMNYCLKILSDFLKNDIYTIYDYESEKKLRGDGNDKQISRRIEKGREKMEKESLSELYKKGYR